MWERDYRKEEEHPGEGGQEMREAGGGESNQQALCTWNEL